ncbi:PP2C family protein-serine/threonine phosphatase [Plantactinospora sp. KBS50]|uniref:PP2C family protein-serine/threonine phosphatase n=1 Tax=Plantactinospora sp. KBS50 TaxID=2024580 RepID=UPI00271467B6|nr:GAF domain-containing SpoIIE family protein phosphatase [Plantactinospora sp. KBS50]
MRLDWAGPVRHDDVLDSLLTTVAGFASQALQRAELIRSTQATADLAARLSAARTVPETIDAILAAVPPVLGAVAPGLLLREGGRRVRLCHHGLPARLAEAYQRMTIDDPRPIAECLRTGQRIVLPDREAFRRRYPDLPDATESSGMVTTVALPLLDVRRRPIAALALGWSRARPFRATDLALLDTVADLCEQALERVRLAAAEHDLVSRLAGRLFDTAGAPPAGLDVAVRYRPAMTGLNLGGDWYDLIRLDGDRLAVVVGDVVGHEVEAAADMAQLRTVVRTLIRLGVPLGDVFSRVTELLGRAFLGTCLILLVDPGRRRVEMVRAGHPHPLWLRHGAPATAVATARALPFGLVDETIPVTELSVQPGDLLVAFTDGLVELRQHAYPDCVATLADVLAEASGGSADEVAAAVMDRLPAAEDDQALVVLRFPA